MRARKGQELDFAVMRGDFLSDKLKTISTFYGFGASGVAATTDRIELCLKACGCEEVQASIQVIATGSPLTL